MRPVASSSRSSRSPKPGPEVEPERVVLALEPAAAEPRTARPPDTWSRVVGELGGQARVAEGVGADEQAEPDALGHGGERGERRPALELRVERVALVGTAGGRRSTANPSRHARPRGTRRAASGQPVRLTQNAAPNRIATSARWSSLS